MLHYLPGCDVRKNHPQAVLKMQKYMRNQNAKIEKCCRVHDKLLEDGDTIINNCTLCDIVLRETHPHHQCLSLYEYVLNDKDFLWQDHRGEVITLQDCWRTRDNLVMQKAIRQCLQKMNFTIIEMEENYDKTKFCGVWLYNSPAQDCIDVAPQTFHHIIENYTQLLPEDKQIQLMKEWVSQYTTEHIVVYCNGCERGIKLGGGKPIHMIELLTEGLWEGFYDSTYNEKYD